jgi:hypothetical protein
MIGGTNMGIGRAVREKGYEKYMKGMKEWKKEIILLVIFDGSCITNIIRRKFYILIKTFTLSESTNRNIKFRGKLYIYCGM